MCKLTTIGMTLAGLFIHALSVRRERRKFAMTDGFPGYTQAAATAPLSESRMTGSNPNDRHSSRFLAGDPAQVRAIRDDVRQVVRAFRFPSADVEEDLVQETLARLVASLSQGRFRGDSSLKTYARYVAKYACLEYRRRRRAAPLIDAEALPSEAHWSDPEGTMLESEEHRRNLRVFSALPADCRELLLLINVQGLSYHEVGARLGITEGAIKSRVRRMRAFIGKLLAPRPVGTMPVRSKQRSVPD